HPDGVGGGPSRRLLVAVPGVERRERAVRPPELRRVADLLGDRAGFPERAPGVVPVSGGARGRAGEAPRLDQVLARVRAGGEIEAASRVIRGRVEIAARQGQLALAGGE